MASFLVFLPRDATGVPLRRLEAELGARGIACHSAREQGQATIDFAVSSDLLYLKLDTDTIRRAELNPDFGARPAVHDRIYDVLDDLGYEQLDEDDPRIAAE
jgi:hypothetical protein